MTKWRAEELMSAFGAKLPDKTVIRLMGGE
jgi:hypothetical protein